MDGYVIDFDPLKNTWLRENRGICFDDVVPMIEARRFIKVIRNHSPEKYKEQHAFLLEFHGECYVVPFVVDERHEKIFLKPYTQAGSFGNCI